MLFRSSSCRLDASSFSSSRQVETWFTRLQITWGSHGWYPAGGWGLLPIYWSGILEGLWSLNACFVAKEVTAEASEACVVTANLCAAWCLCPWLCPESAQGFIPFSVVLVPDLVLDSGVEWAGSGGQGAVAGGIEAVVLPPGSWAASVPGLSQDLSAPDPAPSCGVGWAEDRKSTRLNSSH